MSQEYRHRDTEEQRRKKSRQGCCAPFLFPSVSLRLRVACRFQSPRLTSFPFPFVQYSSAKASEHKFVKFVEFVDSWTFSTAQRALFLAPANRKNPTKGLDRTAPIPYNIVNAGPPKAGRRQRPAAAGLRRKPLGRD